MGLCRCDRPLALDQARIATAPQPLPSRVAEPPVTVARTNRSRLGVAGGRTDASPALEHAGPGWTRGNCLCVRSARALY